MLRFASALYGSIFADESEAAFSNYRLWESLGFIIAFAYSFELCTSVKLYVITSVLVVGWIGFAVVEYIIRIGHVEAEQADGGTAGKRKVADEYERAVHNKIKYDNPGYQEDNSVTRF